MTMTITSHPSLTSLSCLFGHPLGLHLLRWPLDSRVQRGPPSSLGDVGCTSRHASLYSKVRQLLPTAAGHLICGAPAGHENGTTEHNKYPGKNTDGRVGARVGESRSGCGRLL